MLNQNEISRIKEHMLVVGSDNGEVAKVDHIEGKNVKLTKDKSGQHHYIPIGWISRIDDKVHLDRPIQQVLREWSTKPS